MKFCPVCGKEIKEWGGFCPYCGHKLEGFSNQSNAGSQPQRQVSEDDLRIFIGKNADYYLQKFKRFNIGGADVFAPTWNWSAFWGGFGWMLYRKMYMWAIIAFALTLIPHIGLIAWIATGAVSNYLYYNHAESKILEIKRLHFASATSSDLHQAGGTNRWVPITAIVITILLCVSLILMTFVFMIPFNIFNIFSEPSKYI